MTVKFSTLIQVEGVPDLTLHKAVAVPRVWRLSLTSCDNCTSPRTSTCSAARSHADSSTIQNNGIIKVRKDLQDHQSQLLTEHHPVNKTVSENPMIPPTALGSLFQCLTTLSVKKQN